MRCVVDASVAAKWFAPEDDSPVTFGILDHELLAPDLLYAEVANILWKKWRRGEVADDVPEIGARLLAGLTLQVTPCASLMADAVALATRLGHPAYDCFYLALARRHSTPMVTADLRLIARCQQADASDLAGLIQPLAAFGH
ncbi:MAG TPA: type II toxin-antitoxin system VapC family toxin [Rhodocyclaceae bacterium]|nr:type II toxin-antitoxin system VapC family toxin [Rhodocyclaceae bacterium]HNH13949.1 type II toxin-antitoxin system VapC family toxin [Rhodocyclaceae bacterium]HNI00432.1 type II toxin-antitoxin system VapC family toxin [Rhodocyclaceae bacterium]